MIRAHNFKNLTGERFGKLTVKAVTSEKKGKRPMWLCVCDCGKEKLVTSKLLLNGESKTCGSNTCSRLHGKLNNLYKHGYKKDSLYQIWVKMVEKSERCFEWSDPKEFMLWAFTHGYRRGMCCYRIDCTKPYSPDNTRFDMVRLSSRTLFDNLNMAVGRYSIHALDREGIPVRLASDMMSILGFNVNSLVCWSGR